MHIFVAKAALAMALQFTTATPYEFPSGGGGGGGNVSVPLPSVLDSIPSFQTSAGELRSNEFFLDGSSMYSVDTDSSIRVSGTSLILGRGTTSYGQTANMLQSFTFAGLLDLALDSEQNLQLNALEKIRTNAGGALRMPRIPGPNIPAYPPEGGDMLFNMTSNEMQYYNGTSWIPLTAGGGNVSTTLPTTAGKVATWNAVSGSLDATGCFGVSGLQGEVLSCPENRASIKLSEKMEMAVIDTGIGIVYSEVEHLGPGGHLALVSAADILLESQGRISAKQSTGAFVFPFFTTADRNIYPAIAGDWIFNETTQFPEWFNGLVWKPVNVYTDPVTSADNIVTWSATTGKLTSATNFSLFTDLLVNTASGARVQLGGVVEMSGTGANATIAHTDPLGILNFVSTGRLIASSDNSFDIDAAKASGIFTLSAGNQARITATAGDLRLNVNAGDLKFENIPVGTGDTLVLDTADANKVKRVVSSRRFKTDIKDYRGIVDLSTKLKPKTYRYKDGKAKTEIGLIAEDVYKVLPMLVNLDASGRPHSIDYARLAVAMLAEVQHLRERVQELEALVQK